MLGEPGFDGVNPIDNELYHWDYIGSYHLYNRQWTCFQPGKVFIDNNWEDTDCLDVYMIPCVRFSSGNWVSTRYTPKSEWDKHYKKNLGELPEHKCITIKEFNRGIKQ